MTCFARNQMKTSIKDNLNDFNASVADGGCVYGIAVEQAYAYSSGNREKRWYMDLITVDLVATSAECRDSKTENVLLQNGEDPCQASYNIANFSVRQKKKFGIGYFAITHGSTGNNAIARKPVAVALTEKSVRRKLHSLIQEAIEQIHELSGCSVRNDHEAYDVVYGDNLLQRYR